MRLPNKSNQTTTSSLTSSINKSNQPKIKPFGLQLTKSSKHTANRKQIVQSKDLNPTCEASDAREKTDWGRVFTSVMLETRKGSETETLPIRVLTVVLASSTYICSLLLLLSFFTWIWIIVAWTHHRHVAEMVMPPSHIFLIFFFFPFPP